MTVTSTFTTARSPLIITVTAFDDYCHYKDFQASIDGGSIDNRFLPVVIKDIDSKAGLASKNLIYGIIVDDSAIDDTVDEAGENTIDREITVYEGTINEEFFGTTFANPIDSDDVSINELIENCRHTTKDNTIVITNNRRLAVYRTRILRHINQRM
ncbi:hypothetical protein NDU88_002991 [Pleurodeles waltl]|uniref:Uncharacterized protein n=1 Tax=Pleurodeles waltl TaxID=8319 RepID=A0AAV7Q8A2_PLEWA|nr:hypothetical protein NDU88_002991 [Pleurodeles waltl]